MNSTPDDLASAVATDDPNSPEQGEYRIRTKETTFLLILKSLGSLRLTVALLTLGLVVVWIATLQQTRADISQVKHEHFYNPVVSVPFQVLLPPAWFPNTQNVQGGFIIPSGVTIIVLLLVNLLAAHLFRFRVQARDGRLVAGILLTLFGAAVTGAVIAMGNTRGFQDVPWIAWTTLWNLLQLGLGAVLIAALLGVFRLPSERKIEKILLMTVVATLGPLLGYLIYLGEDSFIGDDAMRVVWRLVQGMGAAIAVYVGCVLLFRRKAGIVVIHAGILMLMVGEMYTTYAAREQRMTLEEGGSANHTVDINAVELAVIRPNDDGTERVVSVPAKMLKRTGTLELDELPFKVRTIKYFDNSSLQQVTAGGTNTANRGIGRFVVANPAPVRTGTDSEQVADFAAAYVQLLSKDGESDLGTYLLSQSLYRNTSFDLDSVTVDGQTYQIGLRFKHAYKPYTVELIDTNRTNYVGTQIAQTYSSEFRLQDHQNGVEAVKKISMNNPLRYNNETFYQSGHHIEPDGTEISVLQIVQNTGWMIPYVSCAFVGFGLLAHFLVVFSGFLEKLNRRLHGRQVTSVRWSWAVILALELIFGLWVARQMMPTTVEFNDMRLDQLGKMAVVHGGRVQPLDSLARTTLRQLRKRETAVDASGDQQPAIRWMADVIFGADGYRDYRVFRVDDPEVLSAASLRRRKGHLYSLAELEKGSDELRRISDEAKKLAERDPKLLSNFQKNVVKLTDHVDLVYSLRYAFANPSAEDNSGPLESVAFLNLVSRSGSVPLTVPYEQTSEGWVPMSRYLGWNWLHRFAKENNLESASDMARFLVEQEFAEDLRQDLIKREIFDRFVKEANLDELNLSRADLESRVDRILANPPPQIKQLLDESMAQLEPQVDAMVRQQLDRVAVNVESQLMTILGPEIENVFSQTIMPQYSELDELQGAYLEGDAKTFNSAVESFLSEVSADEGAEFNDSKVSWEVFHNYFSPFYIASALYVIAFVMAILSWLGMSAFHTFSNVTRQSAFWLAILALVIHTIGLIARVYISGRPPVTNLYASAVFIGWLSVLFGLAIEWVTRIGLGTVLSCLGGFLTLIVAYSLAIDGDTFSVLVAVLDTQFWLATHVVCITIGYAATFLAGGFGAAYVIGTLMTPLMTKELRREVIQLCYGITCFALLFSFVGTVLGGLWADDSWGRFWGWDSKENGALMIVLANAILLHARWGGIIREKGIALVAIAGSAVTIWSWFAVNELGIGLHSYGFSEGRMVWVSLAWLIHGLFLAAAFVPFRYWMSIRQENQASSGKTA